jgi:GMP synthase (glutamine-hydrolysing)
VEELPPGFRPLAHSDNSPLAAAADVDRGYYAVQFHPEVMHTPQGHQLLRNFATRICGCTADWTAAHFIEEQVAAIRAQVGNGRVVLG